MFNRNVTAERIRAARATAKWSQPDLCKKIKETSREIVSVQSLSNYERGKTDVPLPLIVVLADIFHVTTDYLLGVSNDPNPYAAEVTAYTGISPQAAKILNVCVSAGSAPKASLELLNDVILSPEFGTMLINMWNLRQRANEIEKIKKVVPLPGDEAASHFRRNYAYYKAVNERYGVAIVLKDIEAVHYEAERIVQEFRRMISHICGVRKAEEIWTKKCVEAKDEFYRRMAEEADVDE